MEQDAQNAAAAQEKAPPKSGEEALQFACNGYASSLALSPAARRQVAEAERVTEQALARLKEIEGTIGATGAEVDTIATDLVPQLQKHTEQLTNVYALIDKMHDHLEHVKESVDKMEARLEGAEAAHAGALSKTWSSLTGNVKAASAPETVKIVSVDEFFASLKV